MKKYFVTITKLLLVFIGSATLLISCDKDKNDRVASHDNPAATAVDPVEGPGGTTVTISGSDLGVMKSIVFDNGNIPAPFNPNFNTAGAVIFRVPDTSNGGNQNILLTNIDGKQISVQFKVIALVSVSDAFPLDFQSGSNITLTGNNMESVTSIVLEGTTDEATIVSKTKKQMVIKMPSSAATTCKLIITNASGVMTTTQIFTNLDAAYKIYTDGLPATIDNWSWSLNISDDATYVITGDKSMKAEYNGDWGGMQLHLQTAVALAPYKYISFWIKGADVDKKMKFNLNWTNDQTLEIPANKWTYYKIDLNLFKNAGVANFDTFVMQLWESPKTLYLDNIVLIK